LEIKIVKDVMAKDKALALEVAKIVNSKKILLVNFMSSPGAGKTELLKKLIPLLQNAGFSSGVIEGDIRTANDAERLQPTGVPIALINTELFGGSCHLSSNVILGALKTLPLDELNLILIENIGNLVCPAGNDTGAHINLVVSSVTEGEDKPLKYPKMFLKTQAAVINKIDIADAIEADTELLRRNILSINPESKVFLTSAKKEIGLDKIVNYFRDANKDIFKSESAAE